MSTAHSFVINRALGVGGVRQINDKATWPINVIVILGEGFVRDTVKA